MVFPGRRSHETSNNPTNSAKINIVQNKTIGLCALVGTNTCAEVRSSVCSVDNQNGNYVVKRGKSLKL